MKLKSSNPIEFVEFTGRYYETVYRSVDDSYCVCIYINEDPHALEHSVTVVGARLPEFTFPVTFRGKWTYSEKHGRQFVVDMVVNQLPEFGEDIVQFISKMKIGIGKKRAEEMVNLVGANRFWDELDRDAMQFEVIHGINQRMLLQLQDKVSELSAQRDLLKLFGGDLPLGAKQYKKICALFKDDEENMVKSIKENPFCLMQCGYSFPELDTFCSHHTLFPLNDYRRLLAATQQALIDAKGQSHVCLPYQNLFDDVKKLLRRNGAVDDVELNSYLEGAVSACDIIYDNGMFYLPRAYQEEEKISEILTQLAQKAPEDVDRKAFDAAMAQYAEEKGFGLSPDQQNAVWTALTRSICVITGGPGTGKSTILDALLFCWRKFHDDDYTLMAPTGKAAVRMTETTGEAATTIHSSLGLNVGNEGIREMDTHCCGVENSLIVVDECSMRATRSLVKS